jgi:hypothetical protein
MRAGQTSSRSVVSSKISAERDLTPLAEHDSASSRYAILQQVPLHKLQLLRREPPPSLPHPRNLERREHPKQHRNRARGRRGVVQHDHRREQRRALPGSLRHRPGREEKHADGAHASHPERHDQSQGPARRDGQVSRGRRAADRGPREALLH